MALTEFFHADAVASVHPLPVSWYITSSLWVYVCSCMHIISMLWSITDAVSSSSCPIQFKILTLNVAICIVRLHFSNFCWSSITDFSNTKARDPTSARRPPFLPTRREMRFELVIWVWVMVIFRWLFLFSSIEDTLINEQLEFPDRTIWSWPLNCRIHAPRTWWVIALNRQRVCPFAFTSTMLLPMAFEKDKIKKNLSWKQHFKNLLGNPPKVTHEPITRIICKQSDIKVEQFTQEESDSVLRKIKNRKAAGLDEIHPEVWKTWQFDDILLQHCNVVYNQNTIDKWTKECILSFPKKGDLGLAKNYRGITLTSIAAMIYNALLRNGIEPKIEKILWKNQNAKKPRGNNIICRLRQGLWLHTQRKDGANAYRLLPTQRNRRSHNDAIQKYKSKSQLPGWKHRLLRHCSRCAARRHISPIHLYHLSRLRA